MKDAAILKTLKWLLDVTELMENSEEDMEPQIKYILEHSSNKEQILKEAYEMFDILEKMNNTLKIIFKDIYDKKVKN